MDVIGDKPHRIILVGGKLFATESEKGWGLEGGMKKSNIYAGFSNTQNTSEMSDCKSIPQTQK